MFKEKKEFKNRRLEDSLEELHSVIASATIFHGDIEGSEGLQISGKIEGSIKSKGLVKVNKGAKIKGPVDAPYLIIEPKNLARFIANSPMWGKQPKRNVCCLPRPSLAPAQ